MLGLQTHDTMPDFLLEFWAPNSNPHASVETSLVTEGFDLILYKLITVEFQFFFLFAIG